MSGQDGIDALRSKNGVGDRSLTPAYHADQLQKVFDETKTDIIYLEEDLVVTPDMHRLDVYPDGGTPSNVTLTMEPLVKNTASRRLIPV